VLEGLGKSRGTACTYREIPSGISQMVSPCLYLVISSDQHLLETLFSAQLDVRNHAGSQS
jgi:hypothetical protein